jgi:hypothetical protein
MSQPLSFAYCSPGDLEPVPPVDVRLAAENAAPALVIAAYREDTVVAYVVASASTRTLEVFCVDRARVYAAARFSDRGQSLFHDRYQYSPCEPSPGEPTCFMETLIFEEPSRIVHVEEYVPGEVTRNVFDYVDLDRHYLPKPSPGDWSALFTIEALASL